MKAIYLNIDPYLQAVADWLASGGYDPETGDFLKPFPKSPFPLPVAVTIPAGQTAGIALQESEYSPIHATIDGQTVYYYAYATEAMESAGPISTGYAPGLSSVAPGEQLEVFALTEDSFQIKFEISFADDASGGMEFTIPVLVRHEAASGPVDLVDFTPPATLTAAAINTALGGTGAEETSPLAGVLLNGAKYLKVDADDPSSIYESSQVSNLSPALVLTEPGS